MWATSAYVAFVTGLVGHRMPMWPTLAAPASCISTDATRLIIWMLTPARLMLWLHNACSTDAPVAHPCSTHALGAHALLATRLVRAIRPKLWLMVATDFAGATGTNHSAASQPDRRGGQLHPSPLQLQSVAPQSVSYSQSVAPQSVSCSQSVALQSQTI